jgi:hypothetical protein
VENNIKDKEWDGNRQFIIQVSEEIYSAANDRWSIISPAAVLAF